MTSLLRRNPAHLHLALMLALTFSTGMIDAVGYLGLDRVFTGNMTGNVVILGMALTGADGLPIIGPVIALVLFMAGAATAGRVLRAIPSGWTTRTTTLFGVVGAILAVGAIASLAFPSPRPDAIDYAVTGALGYAMGLQAGTARHLAVKDVTTVVVTSTLVGFAFDSWLGQGGGQPWKRRAGAIILILLGAFVGAFLLRLGLGAGLAVAAVIVLVVALVGQLGKSATRSTSAQ
jgi:uncharacterized membrane protein YoaK (UPF0700 family)